MKRKRKQYHGKPGTKSLNTIKKYFPKVENLIDANSKVIVEVTLQDSQGGKIRNPALCAFARACYREFEADGVIIGLTTSYIVKGKNAIRFKNTEGISREVVSFDRAGGFDIGSYLLSPFSPRQRLGVYRELATHVRKSGKDRRLFKHYTKGVRVLGRD